MTTEDSLLKRRAEMLAALDARNTAREAERARNKAGDGSDQNESIPLFLERFDKSQTEILTQIDRVKESKGETEEKKAELNLVSEQIIKLQEIVSAAAFFLPPFELRTAQKNLQTLTEQVQATREQLVPKQKFSFRSRKAQKEDAVTPSAVDEADLKRRQDEKNAELEAIIASRQTRIHNITGETIRKTEETDGKDVWISNLKSCKVFMLNRSSALRIDNVEDCTIVMGPVSGSVHIEEVKNCTLYLASRQIRIHNAVHCKFFLHVLSNPIIEHSTDVGFGSYPVEYTRLLQQLRDAGLDIPTLNAGKSEDDPTRFQNKWNQVNDFNWLRQQHSPNWYEVEDIDAFRQALE